MEIWESKLTHGCNKIEGGASHAVMPIDLVTRWTMAFAAPMGGVVRAPNRDFCEILCKGVCLGILQSCPVMTFLR